MEYDLVIEDESFDTFLRRCNRMMKEGWKPQGGVSLSTYRSLHHKTVETVYAQAFVRGDK